MQPGNMAMESNGTNVKDPSKCDVKRARKDDRQMTKWCFSDGGQGTHESAKSTYKLARVPGVSWVYRNKKKEKTRNGRRWARWHTIQLNQISIIKCGHSARHSQESTILQLITFSIVPYWLSSVRRLLGQMFPLATLNAIGCIAMP